MRLVRSGGDAFARGAEGFGEVTLLPEEIEDLWHVFNLLAVGDAVAATTFRKVTKESTTGAVDSQRVKLLLCVRVSKIDFDPEGGALRVGGAVLTEHESVRLGSHHTLELEVHRQLTLTKDNWDSVSLGRIQEATGGPATTADVAAVLVQHGLAHVCLVSGGMTVTKARLEVQVPKKGSAAVMAGAKKSVERWHEQILQAVVRHVDFSRIKCVILAGPGFTKVSPRPTSAALRRALVHEAELPSRLVALLDNPSAPAPCCQGYAMGIAAALVDLAPASQELTEYLALCQGWESFVAPAGALARWSEAQRTMLGGSLPVRDSERSEEPVADMSAIERALQLEAERLVESAECPEHFVEYLSQHNFIDEGAEDIDRLADEQQEVSASDDAWGHTFEKPPPPPLPPPPPAAAEADEAHPVGKPTRSVSVDDHELTI